MAVYVIAEIKVTDDKWVPDYAANVHPIVEKHGGKYCLEVRISKFWKERIEVIHLSPSFSFQMQLL